MKKIKILLIVILMLTVSVVSAEIKGKLGIQIGTGFGIEGLNRVNGGAYHGKNITMEGNDPRWNFKASPIYLSVGANVGRFKHTEWDIELENVKYTSTTIYGGRKLDATLSFMNFNVGIKYLPFSEPILDGKLLPYIKGSLYNAIYHLKSTENPDYKNPNYDIRIDESNVGYAPLLGLHVGANYMYTKHIGAYAQIGYGFEFCQFGAIYQL
jgi:hypothetical protein